MIHLQTPAKQATRNDAPPRNPSERSHIENPLPKPFTHNYFCESKHTASRVPPPSSNSRKLRPPNSHRQNDNIPPPAPHPTAPPNPHPSPHPPSPSAPHQPHLPPPRRTHPLPHPPRPELFLRQKRLANRRTKPRDGIAAERGSQGYEGGDGCYC